jgi:hypothetical protein
MSNAFDGVNASRCQRRFKLCVQRHRSRTNARTTPRWHLQALAFSIAQTTAHLDHPIKLICGSNWRTGTLLEICREEAMKKFSVFGITLAASVVCATPLSLHWSATMTPSLALDQAEARIGRPLTPMSVAGVNRRVHRRAYRHYYYGHPYAY